MTDVDKPLTLKEKKRILAKIPWVRILKHPETCGGWVAGHNRRKIDRERPCKHPGYYKYKALKSSYERDGIQSGVYCFHHLVYRCLLYNNTEMYRFDRWLERRGGINKLLEQEAQDA